ncbi:MAG: T9SS type A sorting domain-containing protein [Bacteroidota bacterium]
MINKKAFWMTLTMVFALVDLSAQGIDLRSGANLISKGPGDAHIVIRNGNWTNEGVNDVIQDHCILRMSGNQDNTIGGSSITVFDKLVIDKQNATVRLGETQQLADSLHFLEGLLDVNNEILQLYTGAAIYDESEANRVIGPNGGSVYYAESNFDPSTNPNPGNLGLVFQGSGASNALIIFRSHVPAAIGTIPTIDRVYDLELGDGPDYTYQLEYFDAELNAALESELEVFAQVPPTNWENESFLARDANNNWVQQNGLPRKVLLTLGDLTSVVLPIELIGQRLSCQEGRAILEWSTASESDLVAFQIESSRNGLDWFPVAEIPAKGDRETPADYQWVSDRLSGSTYFRIVQVQLDERLGEALPIQFSDCGEPDFGANRLFPNPTSGRMSLETETPITGFELIDALGRKVFEYHQENAFNQLTIEVPSTLVAGAYWLRLMDAKRTVLPVQLVRP